MANIKVRVGQSNGVKVIAAASGGSVSAETAINVVSGIASVSQLSVGEVAGMTGVSTFFGVANFQKGLVVNAGVSTFTGLTTTFGDLFVGGNLNVAGVGTFGVGTLTLDGDNDIINVGTGVTIGSAEGIFTPSLSISGILTAASLNITGVSTLTGIVTTGTDLFVGGDLYVQDDLRFDELRARNGIFSGFLSVAGVSTFNGDINGDGNTNITGINSIFLAKKLIHTGDTDTSVTFNDNMITLAAGGSPRLVAMTGGVNGVIVTGDLQGNGNSFNINSDSGSLNITGVSTFVGIGTFEDNLFVANTLTAGLIDGGAF